MTQDPRKDERGSVVVIALVILILFSLVGGTFLLLANTEGQVATNQTASAQTLYVAESGIHAALQEFAASGYRGRTHDGDGAIATKGLLLPREFSGRELVRDDEQDNGLRNEENDGAYVWEWEPGDGGQGLTATGLPECFRFTIRPASVDANEDEYVLDATGIVGQFRRRIQVRGSAVPMFNYSLFSDGDLSEFTQEVDQQIWGRIHANGDIFLLPEGAQARFHIDGITATGKIIRTQDAWGQAPSGTEQVLIQGTNGVVEMVGGPVGVAMDSDHPDWTNDDPDDGIDGALDLWGGVVRDGSLGATHVDVPPVEMFQPGGSFDESADLRILAGDVQQNNGGSNVSAAIADAIQEVTFWNPSTREYVTVQEIDMQKLHASGYFPTNGLIYSEVPLRLANSEELPGPLTVVANHSVYTKGNYNSRNKRAAAIMSTGRIWHLSDAWQDDDSVTQGPVSGRQASNGVTKVMAALLDGQPVVNEANWADLDEDGNPDDPAAGDAEAHSDHFLESWGESRTFMTRGSTIHLQFADMADNVDNSGIAPGEIPWVRHSAYTAPFRDYTYDNSLAGMTGQPPFWPISFKISLWQEINP